MLGFLSLRRICLIAVLLTVGLTAVRAEEAPVAGDVSRQLIPIRLMDMNRNGKLEESDMAEYGRKLVGLYVDEATKDIRAQLQSNPSFKPVFVIPMLKHLRRMADIDRMRAKLLGDVANEIGNLDTNRDGLLDNQEFRKMACFVTGSKALFRDLDGEEAKGYITEDDLLKAEQVQTSNDVYRQGQKAYGSTAKPLFLRDKRTEVSMTTEDVSLIQRYFRDAQTIYAKRATGMDFLVGVIENEQTIQLTTILEKIRQEH